MLKDGPGGVVDDGKATFRDGPGDTCGEKGLSQTGPAAQKQVVDAGTAESTRTEGRIESGLFS